MEFSYPYRYRIIVSLMLPEGYTVEELPKSQRLSACNEGIACTMQVQQQGALMQCLFEFDLSRIIFPRHRIHRPERILRIRHGHVQQPDRP